MQKEKDYNFQDSEDTSHQTSMTPTGFDQIWLEDPEKHKGIAIFGSDLPEINNLSTFEAKPHKKVDTKIKAHVRGKDDKRGSLF